MESNIGVVVGKALLVCSTASKRLILLCRNNIGIVARKICGKEE